MSKFPLFSGLFISTAVLATFTACSSDDGPQPEVPQDTNVAVTLTDGGFRFADGTSMTSTFSEGDKAGLFIVDGGDITASNIELTYDGSSWTSDATLKTTSTSSYYIYLPYKNDAGSKVDKTATGAKEFFAGLSAYATPRADQSDYSTSVKPYDIMYASLTSAGGRSDVRNLSLSGTTAHMLALATWELPGGTRYTTESGFTYHTPGGATQKSVSAGNSIVTPAIANGSYAYYYLPAEGSKLTVTYIRNGEEKEAEISLAGEEGSVSVNHIDGGMENGGTRALKVGDLYYTDGSVLPVEKLDDLPEAPAGVAGVVFCVDPARFSDTDKETLGNVNALVISSRQASFYKNNTPVKYFTWCDAWGIYPGNGDDGNGRFNDNAEDPAYPGLFLPYIHDKSSYTNSYKVNDADLDGNKNTNIIMTRRSREMAAGCYQVFSAIKYLNSDVNVANAANTGWYLPAIGQLFDVIRNLGKTDLSESTVIDFQGGGDFMLPPDASPDLNNILDSWLMKVNDNEKDLFSTSDFALWSSSYSTAYSSYIDGYQSAARIVLTDYDIFYCQAYDVIGRGNARGVLAF